MKNKIIEAEDLTKIYKKSVKAVDHISFSAEEGELLGFLGPDGAGKIQPINMLTTLATITSGLNFSSQTHFLIHSVPISHHNTHQIMHPFASHRKRETLMRKS